MILNTFGNTSDPYEQASSAKPNSGEYGADSVGASANVSADSDRRSKGGGFVLLIFAFLLLVGIFLIFINIYVRPPMHVEEGRKTGSVTILLAGTDSSGLNTDTLMLLNFDSVAKQMRIMSIPRDTKVDCNYKPPKINSAYASYGGGHNGMRKLCEYVSQCVGFYPDGYMLIDLECFVEIVDLFGGVDFDVPMSMHYEDPNQDLYIHLEPGKQHLDGKSAMGLVRFRKGYDMQDLDRVNVQRCFLVSAMEQWKSFRNAFKLKKAFDIVQEHSLTNLSASNLFWMGRTLLSCGTDNIETMTIPYTVGKDYIFIREDEDLLDLINEHFNPYEEPVDFEDLTIAQ